MIQEVAQLSRRMFFLTAAASGGTLAAMAHARAQPSPAPDALSSFRSEAKQLLLTEMQRPSFRGRITETTVNDVLRLEKKTADELLVSLLPLAKTFSHPPLSGFHVGAVILGSSGSLYLGANIEFPGHLLGLATHAEQAALANAYMSGEQAVVAIATSSAPCGHCRQFLNELSPDRDIRVLMSGAPPTTLSALLPMAFGPKDLGFNQGALPVKSKTLSLLKQSSDPLVLAALDAAQKSYSPYTTSPAGIAIITRDSRVFAGSYIENAAFNPSLPPLEAALAGLFAAQQAPGGVTRAVLVECTTAEVSQTKISQESASRAALSSLCPKAVLETVKARA